MEPKTVIVLLGLPGSGKGVLGRILAGLTNLRFIDIDDGPAKCAPPPESDPWRSEETRVYERARMGTAYEILHTAIRAFLEQNLSVIVAAPYSGHYARERLLAAVEKGGGNLKIIQCQYDDTPDEILRRVVRRQGYLGTCKSVSRYRELKASFLDVHLPHLVVMMEGGEEGIRKAVAQAVAYIDRE